MQQSLDAFKADKILLANYRQGLLKSQEIIQQREIHIETQSHEFAASFKKLAQVTDQLKSEQFDKEHLKSKLAKAIEDFDKLKMERGQMLEAKDASLRQISSNFALTQQQLMEQFNHEQLKHEETKKKLEQTAAELKTEKYFLENRHTRI